MHSNGTCPVAGKTRFVNRQHALGALRAAQQFAAATRSRRCVQNIYRCGGCGDWHLTSQSHHGNPRARRAKRRARSWPDSSP